MVRECTWAHVRGQVKTVLWYSKRTEQHNEQTLKRTLQVPVSLIGTRDTVTDLQELQGEDSHVAGRQTQPTGSSVTGFPGWRSQVSCVKTGYVNWVSQRGKGWEFRQRRRRDKVRGQGRAVLARVAGAQGWGGVMSWQADTTPWHIKVPGRTPEHQTGGSHNCTYFSRVRRGI